MSSGGDPLATIGSGRRGAMNTPMHGRHGPEHTRVSAWSAQEPTCCTWDSARHVCPLRGLNDRLARGGPHLLRSRGGTSRARGGGRLLSTAWSTDRPRSGPSSAPGARPFCGRSALGARRHRPAPTVLVDLPACAALADKQVIWVDTPPGRGFRPRDVLGTGA